MKIFLEIDVNVNIHGEIRTGQEIQVCMKDLREEINTFIEQKVYETGIVNSELSGSCELKIYTEV